MFVFDLYEKEKQELLELGDNEDKVLTNPLSYSGVMASPNLGARVRHAGNLAFVKKLDIKDKFMDADVPPMVRHLMGFLETQNTFVSPRIYAGVRPPSGLEVATEPVSQELYRTFKNPASWEDLKLAVTTSQYTPYPVRKIEFYLVSPDLSNLSYAFKELDSFAGKSFLDLSSEEQERLVKKIVPAKHSYAASVIREEANYPVVAKMSFMLTSKKSASAHLRKISFTRQPVSDDGMGTTGRKVYRPSKEILRSFSPGDLPMLIMYGGHISDYYSSVAREQFEFTMGNKHQASPVLQLSREVNSPNVTEMIRKIKGVRDLSHTDTVKQITKDRNKALEKNPKLANPNKREIKVAGSIRSSVARTVIPSIKDEERVWMKADGSLRKPESIGDQEDRGLVPAVGGDAFLRPLVETGDYSIVYGIYYDNPILSFQNRGNIFWYGSVRHLFKAAKTYALWLGDTPRLAYLISSKSSSGMTNANMYITPRELNMGIGDEVSKVKSAHARIASAFRNHVNEGKRKFPMHLNRFLGDGVADQFVGYNTPISWTRIKGANGENVNVGSWIKFLKAAHKELPKQLGFNLGAASNLTITGSDGKIRNTISRSKLTRDEHGRISYQKIEDPITTYEAARLSVYKQKKRVWDVKEPSKNSPESKDVWKNYFINYLLGHKAFSSQLVTFMIPVITSQLPDTNEEKRCGVIPTGSHLSVPKDDYLEAMKKVGNLTGLGIFRNPRGDGTQEDLTRDINTGRKWTYLGASLNQAFPYARMIMPDAVNIREVNRVNGIIARNKKNPLTRTTLGYRYNGFEFRSFFMFVSMPKSIAEKKFRLVSLGEGKNAIKHPEYLERYKTHLKKTSGSPMDLGITPRQSRFVGVGANPYGFAHRSGFKPLDTIKRKQTELPSNYFSHPAFDSQYRMLFTQTQRQVKGMVSTYTHAVEKIKNDARKEDITQEAYDKRMAGLNKKYSIEFNTYSATIQSALVRYLVDFKQEVAKDKTKHFGSLDGDEAAQEAYDNLDVYIKAVKQEFRTSTGGTIDVDMPQIGSRINTPVWTAILGQSSFGPQRQMSIRAPTSDMAKMFIIYRLLRRSVHNPSLGHRANDTFRGTSVRIVDATSSKLLFDWAASGYIVVRHDDPPGLRRLPGKSEKKPSPNEFMVRHSAKHGEHGTARMVKFGHK